MPYISVRFIYIRLYENCRDGGIGIFWLVYDSLYVMFSLYAAIVTKNSGLIGLISGIDGIACGGNVWAKCISALSAMAWVIFAFGQVSELVAAYRIYMNGAGLPDDTNTSA